MMNISESESEKFVVLILIDIQLKFGLFCNKPNSNLPSVLIK